MKSRPTLDLKSRINNLNIEIRGHFYDNKRKTIRRNLRPGDSKSLWQAVNAAKDIGTSALPQSMTFNNQAIHATLRSDCFANHFLEKINSITNAVNSDPNVFNGTQGVIEDDLMFMSTDDVKNV